MMRAATVVHELQDVDTALLNFERRIAVGDIRLPVPAGRFAMIRSVLLGFNGAGPGYTWTLIDRDAVLGPRVKIYGPSGDAAHAVIDAQIRGW